MLRATVSKSYRAGEGFRLITPKIGYVDLERVTNAKVDAMFDKFKDTAGRVHRPAIAREAHRLGRLRGPGMTARFR